MNKKESWEYNIPGETWVKDYLINNSDYCYVLIYHVGRQWYLDTDALLIRAFESSEEQFRYGPFTVDDIPYYQTMIDKKIYRLLRLKAFW